MLAELFWVLARGADFGDALIQGAMELFGIRETTTFDRAAARSVGWRLLDDDRG